MKQATKLLSLLLAAAVLAGLLAGCGGDGEAEATPTPTASPSPEASAPPAADTKDLAVCLGGEPATIDPALTTDPDSMAILQHLFEGLMKWADGGTAVGEGVNAAQLAPGQAESYEKTVSDDGLVTYTFTLRSDAKWSDGTAVTAADFVYAWQRAVDPATGAPYSYLLSAVVNAEEIMTGELEAKELGVAATEEGAFVVTLTEDDPGFLELCAHPVTYPVRQSAVESDPYQWVYYPESCIGNGAYRLESWTYSSDMVLTPNEHYYNAAEVGPDSITFLLMDSAEAILTAFEDGELAFIRDVPKEQAAELTKDGLLKSAPYIASDYLIFNTEAAPFDDPRVREAFTLAVDRAYLVETVTGGGEVAAGGLVPYGVYDAQGGAGADFRTTGGDYFSTDAADYKASCDAARALLAEAGYPGGQDFPQVVYLYNVSDSHKLVAEALQYMWETELGVRVTLEDQPWGDFLATRREGEFSIVRDAWAASGSDPVSYLEQWVTGGTDNSARYASEDFDALIQAAGEAEGTERMNLLHQAEDLLVGTDKVLCPLYFFSRTYMSAEGLEGVVYSPLGYFLFTYAH